MKSKGGLLLFLAVAAAVAAGLILPAFLLRLDKAPSFDLEGYQTVEISSAVSTDYAWRLKVISGSYWDGGSGTVTISDVTEQFTPPQREKIIEQFLAQLTQLEIQGVLPSGTAEKASRSKNPYVYVSYIFDSSVIRGTQCAMVQVPDPDQPGLLLISGMADMESGKILSLYGFTSAWSDTMQRLDAGEITLQEILENYAGYLGMVGPATVENTSGDPFDFTQAEHGDVTMGILEAVLPSDLEDILQLRIEFDGDWFQLCVNS